MEIKKQQLNCRSGLHKCQETNYGLKDRISSLPDEIIVSILSHLTIKDAARTCILSHRWERLWTFTTCLVFDGSKALHCLYERNEDKTSLKSLDKALETERLMFVSWVNKVLESHKGQSLDEFRICFDLDREHTSFIDNWIISAMKRNVKRFELNLLGGWYHNRPTFYIFPDLNDTSLNLHPISHSEQALGAAGFCSLTTLCLNCVNATSPIVEYFLSNCPSLERLCLQNVRILESLKVSGSSLKLKHLEIFNCFAMKYLEISAPSLVSFMYSGLETRISLKSTPSLVDSFIGGGHCKFLSCIFSQLSSCLSQLSKLTLDCIAARTLSFPEKFPELSNLKELDLKVIEDRDQGLLPWIGLIEASPMLWRLKMQVSWMNTFRGSEESKPAKQPHKSLKVVEMLEFVGTSTQVKLLKYLLDNTASLEKIILNSMFMFPSFDGNNLEFKESGSRDDVRKLAIQLKKKVAPSIEFEVI